MIDGEEEHLVGGQRREGLRRNQLGEKFVQHHVEIEAENLLEATPFKASFLLVDRM